MILLSTLTGTKEGIFMSMSLLPYLDKLHQIQVEDGVVEEGHLPSKYPY